MNIDSQMAKRIEGGPEALPSIEDIIEHDPLTVSLYYTDADLEAIAETNPALIDSLADAYLIAQLGVIDAT